MNDLYDDVLTGSVSRERLPNETIPSKKDDRPTKEEVSATSILNTRSAAPTKRLAVYVGNFSWVSVAC